MLSPDRKEKREMKEMNRNRGQWKSIISKTSSEKLAVKKKKEEKETRDKSGVKRGRKQSEEWKSSDEEQVKEAPSVKNKEGEMKVKEEKKKPATNLTKTKRESNESPKGGGWVVAGKQKKVGKAGVESSDPNPPKSPGKIQSDVRQGNTKNDKKEQPKKSSLEKPVPQRVVGLPMTEPPMKKSVTVAIEQKQWALKAENQMEQAQRPMLRAPPLKKPEEQIWTQRQDKPKEDVSKPSAQGQQPTMVPSPVNVIVNESAVKPTNCWNSPPIPALPERNDVEWPEPPIRKNSFGYTLFPEDPAKAKMTSIACKLMEDVKAEIKAEIKADAAEAKNTYSKIVECNASKLESNGRNATPKPVDKSNILPEITKAPVVVKEILSDTEEEEEKGKAEVQVEAITTAEPPKDMINKNKEALAEKSEKIPGLPVGQGKKKRARG